MSAVPWASWPTPFKKEYTTVWDIDQNNVVGLTDVLILITTITAFITMCVLFRKHIIKPLSNWFQTQFAEAVVATLKCDIDYLKHELTINGGGSVKDLTLEIQAQLKEHIERSNAILNLFERLEDLDTKEII